MNCAPRPELERGAQVVNGAVAVVTDSSSLLQRPSLHYPASLLLHV